MPSPTQSQNKSSKSAADLPFERKNQDMVKLPKYARISKRPIPHAPVSSPYAGPSVPKTIYISTSTPYMSAVKRVQKLLRHAEKRATASLSASASSKNKKSANQNQKRGEQGKQEQLLAALARGEEREQLASEEVFVKATGRAMNTALRVGRWFESYGREDEYKVRVKTGSVLVVDDVEEDEAGKEGYLKELEGKGGAANGDTEAANVGKAGEDTTMLTETTGQAGTAIMTETATETLKSGETSTTSAGTVDADATSASKPLSKSAQRKRKRAAGLAASLAETELPETRTRWVNSVEVAISLK
ncbi:ribonuclease P subunit p20 family protein [Aspergillus undulatus]|uniref:ribonuclease P subunit p20 family protein n=1 Tax=Aspergillus undulatus TaxID=1810928 RepID=UPI003CCD74A1